jgi:hypothetical protein
MATLKPSKLNQLEQELPEGLIVDASWLEKKGYSTSLRRQYVSAGWLDRPAGRVYRRRPGKLTSGMLSWQHVVISLQTLLGHTLIVGGRTALELQGYAHYLPQKSAQIHLYGSEPPPGWLKSLKLGLRFVYHNDAALFESTSAARALTSLGVDLESGKRGGHDSVHAGLLSQPWGQWEWPLTLSTPERALLELLNELPGRESFHQVDKLVQGLTTLSPRRLQKLLSDCRSVKVKRLFFFFADRHRHAWRKQLRKESVDLGKGKRVLAKGGKLDPVYQITVPSDLDAV